MSEKSKYFASSERTAEARKALWKDFKKSGCLPFLIVLTVMGGCVALVGRDTDTGTRVKEPWEKAVEDKLYTLRGNCYTALKNALKDPASFKATATNYFPSMEPDPALVMVQVDFRATNSFGGYISSRGVCHSTRTGKVLKSKIFE